MNYKKLMAAVALSLSTLMPMAAETEVKWDVSHPPGPKQSVSLDLKSGTWLSLDLSPDGKTVVFDLLGDLYVMSSQGGEARPLTSGLAWDMQPSFSPDGKKIAFTSDRGGGDNIWVLDVASGERSAKALSQEKFRLLSQPTWDPSGTHVAARKHFTGTRSLGAGEIWAYHLDGGSGVQLTKRANDQLDLGEPAFSVDGRYLYYSLDATGGDRFEYNKDPNKGIYAIERLDRQTGEIEIMLKGAGGAVAPTPSPDGRYLAFVRRIRGKSTLMLLDLKDRSEIVLFDGLDRDMQETWAVHGVYPDFSWTPDSQELVFWAQGTFHKIAIASKSLSPLGFHIKDKREITPALRFPVTASPTNFSAKAIRSPHYSPDGKNIAFEALGKIWIRMSNAAPTRVTTLEGTEGNPRFCTDGRLLFTHWDDSELGSIRIRETSGEIRTLVKDGRFAQPVLSPDGTHLVYRRVGRSPLFDPRYTQQPGLYLMNLASGESRRIESSATSPHFGKRSDVVFYNQPGKATNLMRYDITSGKRQAILSGETVTEFLLSPDESTVAFRDGFQLYQTPFVPTGRTESLSGSAKNLPLVKVSDEVGAYFPAWSGKNRLNWNVGPTVWSRTIGSRENRTDTIALQVTSSAPRSTDTVALVGGKVVTMKGQEIFQDGVIVVQGERITQVGAKDSVLIPPGAKVIDCTGKTVLPGLIDVHWHGTFSDGYTFPLVNYSGLSSLSFGVTTLHDPSNDTAAVFSAKEMQQAGELLAPRIFSTGTILYGAKAPAYFAGVDSLKDALGHLKRLKAWGAISVKSYNQPRREQRQQILEAARQTEMMVVPEGGSLYQHNMTMVVDGHTGVEHALPVANIYDDVVQLWSQTKVGYTPTLGVAYGGIWGENYWYVETDVFDDERLNRFVPREVLDPEARRRFQAPTEEYNHFKAAAGAKVLAEAGVLVNLGAHGQREGLAAHWELWMLEQGGMSPHEALRCGTINGARYLGMEQDLGSLEVGKLADIIVIDGDPLSDIRQSKKVMYTLLGGKVYQSDSMKQIAPKTVPQPKLWWRSK